jgi:hypothetical protein
VSNGYAMRVCLATVAAFTLLTIFAAPAGAVESCPCSPPKPPEEMAREVSYVVEGVAVDKWMTLGTDFHRYAGQSNVMPIEAYVFRVARGWRGYRGKELRLEQGYMFCDHHFAIGRRYLMFVVTTDTPGNMFASACTRFYEGAEIPAVAAQLGPPAASFDLPENIDVPSSPGVLRHLHTSLIASVAAHSWLTASNWTGRAREEWPWSSSPNRAPAICVVWGTLLASLLACAVGLAAAARRQWRQMTHAAAIAGIFIVAGFLLPGLTLVLTNEWLAAAALSWTEAPTATPPMWYRQY